MKTIDFSYFIERYNSGEMDLVEKNWFEKELHGNDTLQKELNLRKKVDNSLIQHDLISLRNKLANIEKERKKKAEAATGKKAVGIRFAAAIMVLVIIGSLYLLTSGTKNPDTLYTRNFQAYDVSSNSRGETSDYDDAFRSALQLYNEMNYTAAAAGFRSYLMNQPQSMEAHLLYGVSEMKNSSYPEAKSAFRTVINHNSNLYIDNAQWYLALCYLKTGEKTEASKQLQAIVNSESKFRARARKILKGIK